MTVAVSLDKEKVRDSFAAAARDYDGSAELQRRVGLELMRRFPIGSPSGVVLDVGCGTGFLTQLLASTAAEHRLIALDLALPMLQMSRCKYPRMPVHYLCADAENLPFLSESVTQIYSNLALQWAQELAASIAGFKRVLRPGGQLVFSTFGPATLSELKTAWAEVDDYQHVNDFHAMDDIEAFLRQADLKMIEIDSVLYQSRYSTVQELMKELKGIGAHNVNRGRNPKPTTKAQLQRMIACYRQQMLGPEIVASYEIIFVKALN